MKFITAQNSNNESVKIYISEASDSLTPNGVIHIYHGLAEYFGRYEHTTKFFNSIGYHVVGIDHRGHGNWIKSGKIPGFFANKDGWSVVIDDMQLSFETIQDQYSEIPHFILAHSMGTWLTIALLQRGISPYKVILSASSKLSVSKLFLQKLIIKLIKFFKGPKAKSYFSDTLTTKQFNAQFKPNRTTHDWLSRNHESVDEYIANPLCGFIPTNQMYEDLASGVIESFKHKQMQKLNQDIPVLLIAGSEDPVGENGKGVSELKIFLNKYIRSIKLILLPKFRHEILNEIDREIPQNHIVTFLES